jgi:hypothetical protein
MLIQDALTGRLHEIPDQHYGSYLGEYGQLYEPQWGEYPQGYGYSPQYGASQVLYDRLGNPVGIFPLLTALAPLAAKVAPVIATKVLPALANKVLPALATKVAPAAQKLLPLISQAMMRSPRRRRGRRVRIIRRQMAVPPPHAIREPIREAVTDEPAGAVQGWGYYGGFNGYGRW